MRIDLLQVNRMSFSAKGQGELKLRWIKYRNLASACFACLSSRSGCEGATELDIMPFFFVFFGIHNRSLSSDVKKNNTGNDTKNKNGVEMSSKKPEYDIDYGCETLTKTFITISSN